MGNNIEDAIREYLEDDIPTSPGGSSMVACCARPTCRLCGGHGWKAVRRLTPPTFAAVMGNPIKRRDPRTE